MLLGMAILPSPPLLLYDCDKVTGDKVEEREIVLIFLDFLLGVTVNDIPFGSEEKLGSCGSPCCEEMNLKTLMKHAFGVLLLCSWRRKLEAKVAEA